VQDYRLSTDNTLQYLVPFPPGELQMVFAYEIDKPESAEFVLPLVVDYPTESLELLIGGSGVKASATGLSPAEPVTAEDNERFIHYQGTDIARDTGINITIGGASGNTVLYIVILCVIIVIMAAGIVIFMKKQRNRVASDERDTGK
jgi:hypothetical protein